MASEAVCTEDTVLTLGWTPEHVDAYLHSMQMQRIFLRGHTNLIPPDYIERSGNAIFIRSAPTMGRPITYFDADSWAQKPGQLISLAISILDALMRIHSINTLHRNITASSVFLDPARKGVLLVTYGMIIPSIDFTSLMCSSVSEYLMPPLLENTTLYSAPLARSLVGSGAYTLHRSRIRAFLAVASTERVRSNLMFTAQTDLYQLGHLIYSLLTKTAPPSPFLEKYEGEAGWQRARSEALKALSGYSMGEYFSKVILRLLYLDTDVEYLSAAEVYHDLHGYWKAISCNQQLLLQPTPTLATHPLPARRFLQKLAQKHMRIHESAILKLLKHISDVITPDIGKLVVTDSLTFSVNAYYEATKVTPVPHVYNVHLIRQAMEKVKAATRQNPRIMSSQGTVKDVPHLCCLTGFPGAGRTTLIATIQHLVATTLAGFTLYVPLAGIADDTQISLDSALYDVDPVQKEFCTHEPGVLACLPTDSWRPILYLDPEVLQTPDGQPLKILGYFHVISLYLVQAILKLDDPHILMALHQRIQGHVSIMQSLPGAFPALLSYLHLESKSALATQVTVTQDFYISLVPILISSILQHVSVFLLVLDDLHSNLNRDLVKNVLNLTLTSSVGRLFVLFSEAVHPHILAEDFSFTPAMSSSSSTNSLSLTRAQRFVMSLRKTSKEWTQSLATVTTPQSSDETRSILSADSHSAGSAVSTTVRSTVSNASSTGSGAAVETVIRPFSFTGVAKRNVLISYCFLQPIKEHSVLEYLFALFDVSEGSQGRFDDEVAATLTRKTGGLIGNLKHFLLSLYSMSGITSALTIAKLLLDLIPEFDWVILRRFHGLKLSGQLTDRDLLVLYTASVFGCAGNIGWVGSAHGLDNETLMTSFTALVMRHHLLLYAPTTVQIAHPSYMGRSTDANPEVPNRTSYNVIFTNLAFMYILREAFTSRSSPKLLALALYLRKRWSVQSLVLERKRHLKPSIFTKAYDNAEFATGQLRKTVTDDFVHVLRGSNSSLPPPNPGDLQLNEASPSVRIARRTTRSHFFTTTLSISTAQNQENLLQTNERSTETVQDRAFLLTQYDGLVVSITTLLSCLNPCSQQFADIYDQYELLRLNTYACEILSATLYDISAYIQVAEAAEHEIWQAIGFLCGFAQEWTTWGPSNYRALGQEQPVLISASMRAEDIDSLLKRSVGVLSNQESPCHTPDPKVVPEYDPLATENLEALNSAIGEAPQPNSFESELAILYNTFPLLLNYTCANSITYSIQALRFAARNCLCTKTYIADKMRDDVYRLYWCELVWEWVLGFIQINRPVRAVFIAIQMLSKLFGQSFNVRTYLPMITQENGVCHDSLVIIMSLVFSRELVRHHGLDIHRDSALWMAFERHGHVPWATPFELLQSLAVASYLERSLQKMLFLIFYALLLRDNVKQAVSLGAAVVERCFLYGLTVEGLAMLGMLASIAPSQIKGLPHSTLLEIVKAVVNLLKRKAEDYGEVFSRVERRLKSNNFIPPLISCVLVFNSVYLLPYFDQSIRDSLTSYKRTIYLLSNDVVDTIIVQPLSLCMYASCFYLSCRASDDYAQLAVECQIAYNYMLATKEHVFIDCVSTITHCSKYFCLALLDTPPVEDADLALFTGTGGASEEGSTPGTLKAISPAHVTLPDFDTYPGLSIASVRTDAATLPARFIALILLESYARAGLLERALYIAKRILHLFTFSPFDLLVAAMFTRVALVHVAAVDQVGLGTQNLSSVERLVLATIDVIHRHSDSRGAYKRMVDFLRAGLAHLRGVHTSTVVRMLIDHSHLNIRAEPVGEQLGVYRSRFFLDLILLL
ncbi:hypothetical protein GMRT_11018 [Giardia muris]|uniref:Protein kinase domain-containing protein n=1 Tax=Giardia muris TaxID=5742 RepID=A0A4Z1SWR8_GIAMU|nr:hypothetical protein GMRT_11018 [Giardia muris]|eukprot:TNJ29295.1 hypothetical protein GMRT_11018 [Giardia muris]